MINYLAWKVSAKDFPADAELDSQIAFICRYAILAPSVHNVQPWRFEVKGSSVRIHLVPERVLEAGDPTGRESWLSIGAAVENMVIAAEYFGLSSEPGVRDASSITVNFTRAKPKPELEGLMKAIIGRTSNRTPYDASPVDQNLLSKISANSNSGVQVLASNDRDLIKLIADLTGRAIAIALGNPSFRHELSTLVHPNRTKKSVGMPAAGLAVSWIRSHFEKGLIHSGAINDAQGKKEYDAMIHSGAVVLVFTEGDAQPYWIEAGRAYQHAALVATANGLGSSTMAATVEAADFHLDVESYCKAKGRLQTVMRIGRADKTAVHSPRLNLEEVLTFSL